MRILMISSEGPPLTRPTALVDVLEALPRELRVRGHEVACALPFYREIRENSAVVVRDTGITVDVRVGTKNHVAEYLEDRTAGGVQIFFSKAALELARRLAPAPQILHLHDWAPALVPVLVKESSRESGPRFVAKTTNGPGHRSL
jgi:starch synthase